MLDDRLVAVKFESKRSNSLQLKDEFRHYRMLNGCKGIPQAYYYGQDGLHNMLIIDKLGPSLEMLFNLCGRKFSVKTVCLLAVSMISRIQTVHENDLVYRDIKPDNFLMGLENTPDEDTVFMVDFGMAKMYRDPVTKAHIEYREQKSLSGTARYMSIHTHLGREQSRRDDLEAIGYVCVYFLLGSLPWQNLKAPSNCKKYEMIGDKKQSTAIETLTKECPDEFTMYLKYVQKLTFTQDPDYKWLIDLMNTCLARYDPSGDGIYDWKMLKNTKPNNCVILPPPQIEQPIPVQPQIPPKRSWLCCFSRK